MQSSPCSSLRVRQERYDHLRTAGRRQGKFCRAAVDPDLLLVREDLLPRWRAVVGVVARVCRRRACQVLRLGAGHR
jgi:hypothetical protein